MSVGIVLFILIPAFPVAIAIACLPMRRRWIAMSVVRWALLFFCAVGLLLWSYDAAFGEHLRRQLGFDENLFGIVWIQAAAAYPIALLVSWLSPWRRPKKSLNVSSA